MTDVRVGIVIPVYNRSETLRRTLASLEPQTVSPDSMTVVVADDGSEEDIASIVDKWTPPFAKQYVRQERRGFGAARARNRGAGLLEDGVVIFLDSDGIVRPDFVERHLRHHRNRDPRIVIGGRIHLEASDLTIEALSSGTATLGGTDESSADFRTILSRRTAGYKTTDEGYRAFVSSNVSLPLSLHRGIGGFDERFRWWGSEDTEYGWRLWQTGAEFVDDSENAIFHQTDADTAGGAEGRQRARELNRGLLTSLVPQRFYRKSVPDPLPEVPKISVLLDDIQPGLPAIWWSELKRQTSPDFELLVIADPAEHDPFAGAAEGDPRIGFVSDLDGAIAKSRGEYLLVAHGPSAPGRTLLQNVARRLDNRPAAAALTFGVSVPGIGDFGLVDDVESLGSSWGFQLPLNLAVRRRWLAQQMIQGSDPADSLKHAAANAMHTRQALIALPDVVRVERPDGFSLTSTGLRRVVAEAQAGGASQALRAGVSVVRESRRSTSAPKPPTESSSSDPAVGVRYIGWVGKDNLGDEVMLDAARQLMPWAEVSTRGEARNLLLLGGGTLINRNQYLDWVTQRDSPRLERAILGTGVASPDYWGVTEDPKKWKQWIESCAYVGVRGPKSLQTLAEWGADDRVEVCGDLALALVPPKVEVADGRVLIAPAATNGQLWGESDGDVFAALAESAASLIDEGRDVVLMSCHPSDDRPIIEIRQLLEGRPTRYLAGYLDTAGSLAEIAAADSVVGERLHACVLAAAAGRPFVALEYRPKVADFAESVAMAHQVIRTDRIEPGDLTERVRSFDGPEHDMLNKVAEFRKMLAGAAETIRGSLNA